MKPVLSIVTPTRGNFSEYWLEQLLKIKGDVEFILVFPPGVVFRAINDPRVKVLASPFKGEVMQRATGLLNISGEYVIALDDDDFAHPDIVELVSDYFKRFPESWVVRLFGEGVDMGCQTKAIDWKPISVIEQLQPCSKTAEGISGIWKEGGGLLELPIAPLDNKFNVCFLFWPFTTRKDHHGIHIENFIGKVWKSQLVKDATEDLLRTTQIVGPLTWIPFWNLDRLLGLFIQAKYFKKELIVGHWLPKPPQFYKNNVPNPDIHGRFHVSADVLLIKRFPQYGYFWNLVFDQLWAIPKRAVGYLGRKLFGHRA